MYVCMYVRLYMCVCTYTGMNVDTKAGCSSLLSRQYNGIPNMKY